MQGVTQRKRWVCGFFQALSTPLRELGFTPWERFKAWLVFFPCLSLSINALGIPTGLWALWVWLDEKHVVPHWTIWLSATNFTLFVLMMIPLYVNTWRRTALVLDHWTERVWYMLRINPLFAMWWWIFWIVPLAIGFRMFIGDGGLVWQRTEKVDANNVLVRSRRRERVLERV